MGKKDRGIPPWAREKLNERAAEAPKQKPKPEPARAAKNRFNRKDICGCGSGKLVKDCCTYLLDKCFSTEPSSKPVRFVLMSKGAFIGVNARALVFRTASSANEVKEKLDLRDCTIAGVVQKAWEDFRSRVVYIEEPTNEDLMPLMLANAGLLGPDGRPLELESDDGKIVRLDSRRKKD